MAVNVVLQNLAGAVVGQVFPGIQLLQQNPTFIRVANASPCFITVDTDQAARIDSMVPGEINVFALPRSCPSISVTVTALLSQLNPPATSLVVTVFSGEDKPTGNYPLIGPNLSGSGTLTVSQASSVKNDGAAAGTVFVESTASGDSSSDVTITTDGFAFIKGQLIVGTLSAGTSLAGFPHNLILAQGGSGGCNILPDNPSGTPAVFAAYGWSGSAYNQAFTTRSDGGLSIPGYLTWGNLAVFLKQAGKFNGAASGNYSTGCTATVGAVFITQSSAGSSTYGWDTPTGAGVVHITSGSGAGFVAIAFVT